MFSGINTERTEEIDLIRTKYEIDEDGTGVVVNLRCESIVSEQHFEWVRVDDDTIRMVPPDGADSFENITATSILLHRATECIGIEPPLAQYAIEYLENGKLEGGIESMVFRTNFCAEAQPVMGPCPDNTECGPGFCDYFWCEGEEPEACDLDD